MFEKDAEEYRLNLVSELREKIQNGCNCKELIDIEMAFQKGAEFGYNKANEEHKGKCKTAYIKGIRTMANALKDYDRTDGAWTDYFVHTVDNVLNRLLKENE